MKLKFDIKNNFVSFLMTAVSALLILLASIFYFITMNNHSYPISSGIGLFFVILVLILGLVLPCYTAVDSDNNILAILRILVIVLAVVIFGIIINNRILAIAGINSYDAGKPEPIKAVTTGITSAVLYLVSAILLAVTSFFGKKEAK